MALTFDDLPYVSDRGPGALADARRVTAGILEALAEHEAPAVGLVNESRLHVTGEMDERSALLQRWIDAGAILGNHTFSHVDLNQVSVAEYMEEIVRGEIVTRRLMRDRQPCPLYFRHPYTHTGDTEEKKAQVERFLGERGYAVAPFTIDGQDYVFNRAYLLARERGDEEGVARIRGAYVDFTLAATAFAESAAAQLFGRDIPQTLLVHANDITADCLDDLLHALAARGYRFVSLERAMADAAYRTPDTLVTEYGPSWLWRWTKSQDRKISFRGDPEPPGWILDLTRRTAENGGESGK